MKKVSIVLLGLVTTLSVLAHHNIGASAVTITVNGNRNLQILVDGREYNLFTNTGSGNKTTISLTNLESGQHTFEVTRSLQNKTRPDRISATFNLRIGYDMLITVNGNGSIELIEKKKIGVSDNQPPMNNATYNKLLQSVKNQRSVNGKRSLVSNAFNNENNYFTTYQVVQLLQQINSESFRLQMAKLSYRSITDRENFDDVYSLLNSQASKNEMEAYVNDYTEDNDLNTAMSDASFSDLLRTIRQQWPASTQMNSLNNTFNNPSYFFTVSQARQLIQIANTESNRLQLAKLSYRSITDPTNFNQVYDLLSSQASKSELTIYVNNYTDSNSNVAMTDAAFNSLYQDIRMQWPATVQMSSLSTAFNNNYNFFTAYQASQLIQIVIPEDYRLQLAKLSYRAVTDRNNFARIFDLLNNTASKNELTNYINNYSGHSSNTAMPDASFTTLYQTIKGQYFPNEKNNSLTNTFNTANNYFSTAQAKQLIQLVSFESNRLQLAKLSYHTITDRTNFKQLYDILISQASRDDLDAFVNAFKE